MASLRAVIIAGAVAIGAFSSVTVAKAADLDMPPPPPVEAPPPPVVSGWYLRGDVGAGIDELSHFSSNVAGTIPGFAYNGAGLGEQAEIGAGVGYRLNNWIRFDVTGEYRTDTKYWGLESYTNGFCGIGTCYDGYHGHVGTIDTMANGYVDLGTWWNLTPFIGGGVGVAFNRFGGLTDTNYSVGGGAGGVAPFNIDTNLAWNVQAGIDYAFAPNWVLEFSYRYFDGGTVRSDGIVCNGTCGGGLREVQSFHLYSDDIRLGLRYMFAEVPAVAPPLVTKY